ncbi:MAG: hypothetical protein ACKOEL_06995 [Planctomycetota bacterium]
MMNKTLIVAGASALLAASADAAVVTSWNFNAANRAAVNARGSTALVIGSATVGFAAGSAFDTAPGTNRAARIANFSTQATQSGRRGMQFQANTNGFSFISVGFALSGHARSSRWGQFQYSTNGGRTYTVAGLSNAGRFRVKADGTFTRFAYDLSFADGVSDNGKFRFRIVAVKDPTSGGFIGANGAPMLGSAFWNLDRVLVTGTSNGSQATPAPGAIALLAVAGAVGATRRRA